jgi:hypothetical protein
MISFHIIKYLCRGGVKIDDDTKIILKIAEDVSAIKATIEHEKDEVSELKIRTAEWIQRFCFLLLRLTVLIMTLASILILIFVVWPDTENRPMIRPETWLTREK